jgi:hypothetical protein
MKALLFILLLLGTPAAQALDVIDALTDPTSLDYILYHDTLVGANHDSSPPTPLTPEQIQHQQTFIRYSLYTVLGFFNLWLLGSIGAMMIRNNPVYQLRKFSPEDQKIALQLWYGCSPAETEMYRTLSYRGKKQFLTQKQQERLSRRRI